MPLVFRAHMRRATYKTCAAGYKDFAFRQVDHCLESFIQAIFARVGKAMNILCVGSW